MTTPWLDQAGRSPGRTGRSGAQPSPTLARHATPATRPAPISPRSRGSHTLAESPRHAHGASARAPCSPTASTAWPPPRTPSRPRCARRATRPNGKTRRLLISGGAGSASAAAGLPRCSWVPRHRQAPPPASASAAVASFCKWAVRHDLLDASPMDRIDAIEVPRTLPRPAAGDVAAVLDAICSRRPRKDVPLGMLRDRGAVRDGLRLRRPRFPHAPSARRSG
jgi:hypothetical protein